MSRMIQIGGDPVDRPGTFKVGAGIGDVKASGHLSNEVQIGRAGGAPTPLPSGPVEVHRSIAGATIVKAGGLEMSEAEARALGVLDADGKPVERRQAPEGPSRGAAEDDPADAPEDAPEDDLPTVTPDALQAHADRLNAAGSALEGAGLDPLDALERSVAGVAATGAVPDDVTAALGDRADGLADALYGHAEALVADAMRGAGLSPGRLSEADTAALEGLLDENLPAIVDALRGRPQALNSLVASFASSRSRSR